MSFKPVIAALFVLLVLMNTMGYYFIVRGWELNHDVTVTRALDEDSYDPSKVVTIRVPIALPYQYDNPDFVRVEGKFKYAGNSYRLIKQKYAGDTLTIICMKDDHDSRIQDVKADIVSTFADGPIDAPLSKVVSLIIKEYLLTQTTVRTEASGWTMDLADRSVSEAPRRAHTLNVVQPPEA